MKKYAGNGDPTGIWVVVPAHDEEDLIGACLASIEVAAARVTVPVVTTVVLDACTDHTADRIPSGVRSVEVLHRNAGAARWSGLLGAPVGPGIWYATTDADSLVPPSWFEGILASARAGHDVVAGTIVVDDWEHRDPRLRPLHDAGYRQEAGHRHIHGANLALASTVYQAVGGFRALPEHEDVDLVTRCGEAGYRIDWSGQPPVITSARRTNRAPGGFAGFLNRLEEDLTS